MKSPDARIPMYNRFARKLTREAQRSSINLCHIVLYRTLHCYFSCCSPAARIAKPHLRHPVSHKSPETGTGLYYSAV